VAVTITILRIFAIVVIILGALAGVFILRFLARFLKKQNKSFSERARDVRKQVSTSIEGIDTAQEQIAAIASMTEAVQAGMVKTLEAADRTVGFLESRAFQIGLPAVLWFLLLVVALPRGLARRTPKTESRPRRVILPPSREAAARAESE
jgi:predicted PurR-regulated permease PerM